MLRLLAIVVGVALIFIGVAGNMPTFMQNGLLYGYFEVDQHQNLIHIIAGVVAIMAGTRHALASLFFKLLGLTCMGAAIYSFWNNGDLIITHLNLNDNILYIIIGVFSLLVGFNSPASDN